MEVSSPGRERDGAPQVLPIVVRSLTCEGVGLSISGSEWPWLERGTPVMLRFCAGERVVELPGHVAWQLEGRDPDALCDLGVRWYLEDPPCDSMLAYAAWIVERIGRRMNREMEVGVVLLQVAHLSLETLDLALAKRRGTWRSVGEVLLEMNAITKYELRVAESCRLRFADEALPASLLEWQRGLVLRAGAPA